MDIEKYYKLLKENKLDFIGRHSHYGMSPTITTNTIKDLKLHSESIKYLVTSYVDHFINDGNTISDFNRMISNIEVVVDKAKRIIEDLENNEERNE